MRQQTIRYATTGALGIILMIGLTLMVNWLSVRHWHRLDWTSAKLYSLSDKSLGILAELDQEIQVYVFLNEQSSMFRQVDELLNRYAAASPMIKVEYVDPDRDRLRAQQLAEKFRTLDETIVFAYGDRIKYVTSDKLAELDYSGAQFGEGPKLKAFKGEEQFTSAILSLVSSYVPKVFLVSGHGEASPTSNATGQSVTILEELLKRDNIEIGETSLMTGEIPEDADILIILGPTHAYTEDETALLAAYLDQGGRMLVCLDPRIDRDGTIHQTGLETLLESYGVHVNNDLLIDPSSGLQGFDLSTLFLADYQSHAITTGLQGVGTRFDVARSLEPNEGLGWDAQVLVETTEEGWGETDIAALLQTMPTLDETDNKGPAAVAVVVEARVDPTSAYDDAAAGDVPEPDQSTDESTATAEPAAPAGFRLVVFGDADFLCDSSIVSLGNMTLALNAVNWLAEREQMVGIPPREVDQPSVYLATGSLIKILLITVFAMPGAAIVLGIIVWRRRRH